MCKDVIHTAGTRGGEELNSPCASGSDPIYNSPPEDGIGVRIVYKDVYSNTYRYAIFKQNGLVRSNY